MAIDGCAPRAKMNQQRPGLNGSWWWWWWSHPLLNFSICRVQDLTSDQRHAKASWMLRLSEISSCQWCARSTRACTADGGGQLWGPTGVGNIMTRKDLKYFSEMISDNKSQDSGILPSCLRFIYGYSISRSTGHVWSSLWLQLYYSRRVGSESNTSWLDRLVESENDLFGEWSFEDPKSKRIESLDVAFKTLLLGNQATLGRHFDQRDLIMSKSRHSVYGKAYGAFALLHLQKDPGLQLIMSCWNHIPKKKSRVKQPWNKTSQEKRIFKIEINKSRHIQRNFP